MEICFLVGAMSKGGAEKQLVYIANGLSRKGHQVKILSMREGSAYADILDDDIEIHVLNVSGFFDSLIKTYKYLSSDGTTLLVCFLYHATIVGRLVGAFLSVDVVSSYRNVSYGSKFRDLTVRWTSFLDGLTLSNVSAAKEKLCFPFSKNRLQVIPNIFLIDRYDFGDLVIPEKPGFRWCYVGRLEDQKNIKEMIVAFKLFKKVCHDADLLILGEGRQRSNLEAFVSELNVDGIYFLGHSYLVGKLFQSSDAFILPSKREGMPNALMEAMESQLPCVATPVGAVPEMIIHGETGFLATGLDASSLCDAMLELYGTDEVALARIAKKASLYIEHNCSESAVIAKWEEKLSGLSSKC